MKILAAAIWQTAFWVLVLGAIAGIVIGLLLLFRRDTVLAWSAVMNRWVSTRLAMRPLEEPLPVERHVYRNHRVIGLLIVAGATYALYVFAVRVPIEWLVATLGSKMEPVLARALIHSVRVFILITNAAALLAGLVMLFRPSALKGLEGWANRSWSARKATRPLEIPRYSLDRYVERHPALVGTFLVIGSIYVLIALAFLRYSGQWIAR